ncbi:MAG: copper transporter [Actinomycetota bacterium]|nr:copper transporter [Actinomycetota bacterium]
MVDFRYHLISIIAVILALAVGIFAGSGFLGGPLLDDLRHRLDRIDRTNTDLQKQISTLHDQADDYEAFVTAAEPYIVAGKLTGTPVVLFSLDGTDGRVLDGVTSGLDAAGARVVSTITFSSKLALPSSVERDQLALALGSTSGKSADLRDEAATELSGRIANVLSGSSQADPRVRATTQLEALLDSLEKQGFVDVAGGVSAETVPVGASFVIAVGSGAAPPFNVAPFVRRLAVGLARPHVGIVVASPTNSVWDVIPSLRQNPEASASVTTVDDADTSIGRIACALGLASAARGTVGQYGVGDRSSGIIPPPSPAP